MSNIKVIFTLSYVAIFPKAALQPLPAAATFLSVQISIFSTPYTTTTEPYIGMTLSQAEYLLADTQTDNASTVPMRLFSLP